MFSACCVPCCVPAPIQTKIRFIRSPTQRGETLWSGWPPLRLYVHLLQERIGPFGEFAALFGRLHFWSPLAKFREYLPPFRVNRKREPTPSMPRSWGTCVIADRSLLEPVADQSSGGQLFSEFRMLPPHSHHCRNDRQNLSNAASRATEASVHPAREADRNSRNFRSIA